MNKYPNLKKFQKGQRRFVTLGDEMWTLDNLRDGFQYFFDVNNRYPNALEIDRFDYLPTSRTIQRRFGGLQALRKVLGLGTINFSAGETRSESARIVGQRGFKIENELGEILVNKFGQAFVHLERPFGNSKRRIDFYIFCPDGNFGLDVFYPASVYNMKTILNLKIKAYNNRFMEDNYLVVSNPEITQEQIDSVIEKKIKKLPLRCQTVSLQSFRELIKNKRTYRIVEEGE